jgi:hypothetical protein
VTRLGVGRVIVQGGGSFGLRPYGGNLVPLSCRSVFGLFPLLLMQSESDRLTLKLGIEDDRPCAGADLAPTGHGQIASF